MKKHNIAIIGLGYWGTIVTNTVISMGLFKKVYIHDKMPLEKIVEAHNELEGRKTKGGIVITL